MKKIIPALAVLGGVAAFAVYKLKKEEKKHVVDLDQGLLYDEENEDDILENSFKKAETEVQDLPEHNDTITMDNEYPSLTSTEVENLKNEYNTKVEELASEGDILTKERPVRHNVCFYNEVDLEHFKKEVINRGFVISTGEEPLNLVVLHISPINTEKLVDNILYLASRAKENKGTYNNWETKVIYG